MNIKQLKKIKGILFDLDGTLVSNDGIQEESILKTFDFFNINIPLKEFSERFTGKGLPQIEKELIKEFNLDIKEGDIREKRKEIVVKLLSEKKSKCTYFAKEIIEFLNTKYPLAICSAGEKEEVHLKLKNNDLLKYFKKVITAQDVERSKPYPDIYIKGALELGLSPKECLAFEDTVTGLVSAKEAGTICFVIPSRIDNIQDFSLADKVLKTLKDAYNILKSI